MADALTLRRVVNGWIIAPHPCSPDAFTHVATTPEDLARHVMAWAQAQIEPLPKRATERT